MDSEKLKVSAVQEQEEGLSPSPIQKNQAIDVAKLRSDAKDLVLKQAEMMWGSWVEGNPSDLTTLYREYKNLFIRDSISATTAAIEKEQDPVQKKALQFFKNYLQTEFIGKETSIYDDIQSDLEAELKVLVNGSLVPYRDLTGVISNEPERLKRGELVKEEYRTYDLLNKVVLNRHFDEAHRLAKELGYKDYAELSAAVKMVDLDALIAEFEKFLDASETIYKKLFDMTSPIPRSEFHRSDIPYLLGARDFDKYFPKEKLIPSLKTTWKALGVNIDEQSNVMLHDKELPKKNPRAVCFPLRVPEEIRTSIKPSGGKSDYDALFHEFGHAEHFAHSKTPIWEFQQLGSNAVTESYAYLFESLPSNLLWLDEYLSIADKDRPAYRLRVIFTEIYMARRYMAKTIYEVKFHRGSTTPKEDYRKIMSRAYGFELTDEEATRYLSDIDSFIYAVDYAQAFILRAMLEAKLKNICGQAWWHCPEAYNMLSNLWASGNELYRAELAAKLGYEKGISTDILIQELLKPAENLAAELEADSSWKQKQTVSAEPENDKKGVKGGKSTGKKSTANSSKKPLKK